jgi:hypothetical protein
MVKHLVQAVLWAATGILVEAQTTPMGEMLASHYKGLSVVIIVAISMFLVNIWMGINSVLREKREIEDDIDWERGDHQ